MKELDMTEKELWKLIEDADWKLDHDYERIKDEWSKLDKDTYIQLKIFTKQKNAELESKFNDAWLDKDGKGGFRCCVDGWNDLIAEVVSRGEEFYNNITSDKLRQMAKDNDYYYYYNYDRTFNFMDSLEKLIYP